MKKIYAYKNLSNGMEAILLLIVQIIVSLTTKVSGFPVLEYSQVPPNTNAM